MTNYKSKYFYYQKKIRFCAQKEFKKVLTDNEF